MIQYMSWKLAKVTGNITLEYLSMSDAVIPNILFKSFTLQSGFSGGSGCGVGIPADGGGGGGGMGCGGMGGGGWGGTRGIIIGAASSSP